MSTLDKLEAIKKLNQIGFKAKDEQNMVYVDLTKISDEEIVDTIFSLQNALKEMEYNKSYGFKYNSSALDIVTKALKKARDSEPTKETSVEPEKKTRTRAKKSEDTKTSSKKKDVKEDVLIQENKPEEKPKRTRKSSNVAEKTDGSSRATTQEKPARKPRKKKE